MKTDVRGKWALITGANRGIGYRVTKFMAAEGCNLILHSELINDVGLTSDSKLEPKNVLRRTMKSLQIPEENAMLWASRSAV